MRPAYSRYSPYADTGSFGDYLDILRSRPIPARADDVVYEIDKIYQYRPDLLAHDLYGSAELWWIFAQRNPDVISDSIRDFVPGKRIYIPKKDVIVQTLGL
jgi:hypothetical protein